MTCATLTRQRGRSPFTAPDIQRRCRRSSAAEESNHDGEHSNEETESIGARRGPDPDSITLETYGKVDPRGVIDTDNPNVAGKQFS